MEGTTLYLISHWCHHFPHGWQARNLTLAASLMLVGHLVPDLPALVGLFEARIGLKDPVVMGSLLGDHASSFSWLYSNHG